MNEGKSETYNMNPKRLARLTMSTPTGEDTAETYNMNPKRLARLTMSTPTGEDTLKEKKGLCFEFIESGSCSKGEDCPHLHGF